jgi:hypothetical protein
VITMNQRPLAESVTYVRALRYGAPQLSVSRIEHERPKRKARPAGLEPATPGLEGRCSIQLSYGRGE